MEYSLIMHYVLQYELQKQKISTECVTFVSLRIYLISLEKASISLTSKKEQK